MQPQEVEELLRMVSAAVGRAPAAKLREHIARLTREAALADAARMTAESNAREAEVLNERQERLLDGIRRRASQVMNDAEAPAEWRRCARFVLSEPPQEVPTPAAPDPREAWGAKDPCLCGEPRWLHDAEGKRKVVSGRKTKVLCKGFRQERARLLPEMADRP